MSPTPLYDPSTASGAYQLRYSWTGWPSAKSFDQQPIELIERTKPLWEVDGLRVLEFRWTGELVQILFSTKPNVSPVFVAARVKGRLDHALRAAHFQMEFSRKVSVRSVGDNTRDDVEAYIDSQVTKERFVDPRFAAAMAEFTVANSRVDLEQPFESARGRYWYNLHVVLVVDGRYRVSDPQRLGLLREGCFKIAAKKQQAISRVSVMPDHLHLALRPTIDEAPVDVVFAYQNNLAHMAGLGRLWSDGFYVGTFGEYTTQAVRIVNRPDGGGSG